MFNGARILVAPLDWGLGHAARCVPLIRRLLEHDAVPVIGADKAPLAMLRAEFPKLEHVIIPGMEIRYSTGRNQMPTMIRQFPRLLRQIREEHQWTRRAIGKYAIDGIISDQRFGVRSTSVPSVLVTHQVFPKSPVLRSLLQRINLRLIARFGRCWVLDEAASPGLAGELSHGPGMPGNTRYIGIHSRFEPVEAGTPKRYKVVAVLSGPEPQRGMLERTTLAALRHIPGDHLLVQGLPPDRPIMERGNISIAPSLATDRLQQAFAGAGMVIARSGYTTLMDLHVLGVNALLIPTPGQPEQEYLATLHSGSGRYMIQTQDRLDIAAALDRLAPFSPERYSSNVAALDEALAELAGLLRRRTHN